MKRIGVPGDDRMGRDLRKRCGDCAARRAQRDDLEVEGALKDLSSEDAAVRKKRLMNALITGECRPSFRS